MGKVNNIWSYLASHSKLITIVICTAIVCFIDENSFRKYITLQMKYRDVKEEYNQYVEQFTRDSIRLSQFEANHKGVEHIARERYFMKRPNEEVFVLTSEKHNGE